MARYNWQWDYKKGICFCSVDGFVRGLVNPWQDKWHYDALKKTGLAMNESDAKACVEMILDADTS